MERFRIVPEIIKIKEVNELLDIIKFNQSDLVFLSDRFYDKYFKDKLNNATRINLSSYGKGEPTDEMVDLITKDIKRKYNRVIAIGGGAVLDVAKLFALKDNYPIDDLFLKKIKCEKECELILIPTTCGTGSEVTNISILSLINLNTKFGLADDTLFADKAILCPKFLEDLPINVFAASSIDALVHSIESYTSPKANEYTKLMSISAMRSIINCYKDMYINGLDKRYDHLEELLDASTKAGIAFGNAGCAAVHALAYPLGAKYHVAHGESNYAMFSAVYKMYMHLKPIGIINDLNKILADLLECSIDNVYIKLEQYLNNVLIKKSLREYGVTSADLVSFSKSVLDTQTRLLSNNYTKLDYEHILEIYKSVY